MARSAAPPPDELARVFREESGTVLAALIAQFRDFDAAEEALADAMARAAERWVRDGVPDNPAAWLTTVAKRRALDGVRHRQMRSEKMPELTDDETRRRETDASHEDALDMAHVPDERLRLIFTCCHPSLALEAQVALTLQTLGGLSTREVARAFLSTDDTMTRRLSRAKNKIRQAGVPYEVPGSSELPERLGAVLGVLYLIFNQGYSAAADDGGERGALCAEAIRLTRVVAGLMPDSSETLGLLALLLLHDARRAARVAPSGEMIPLDEQDPKAWDWAQIQEGRAALMAALAEDPGGAYAVQAAISAVHVEAAEQGHSAAWRWGRIAGLYDRLAARLPTPVVELNRAVAHGQAGEVEWALEHLASLVADDSIAKRFAGYQPYHAAQADLLRRAGRNEEAAAAYGRAIELAEGPAERRFLEARRDELAAAGRG